MTLQPKCPDCGASGIENFGRVNSIDSVGHGRARYGVICCTKCGHVYGIVPLMTDVIVHPEPTPHPDAITHQKEH